MDLVANAPAARDAESPSGPGRSRPSSSNVHSGIDAIAARASSE